MLFTAFNRIKKENDIQEFTLWIEDVLIIDLSVGKTVILLSLKLKYISFLPHN